MLAMPLRWRSYGYGGDERNRMRLPNGEKERVDTGSSCAGCAVSLAKMRPRVWIAAGRGSGQREGIDLDGRIRHRWATLRLC